MVARGGIYGDYYGDGSPTRDARLSGPEDQAMTATPMTPEREDEAGEFVLVPREPTPDMRIAGGIAWSNACPKAETMVDCADACFKAMLAASPAPTGAGEAEKLADERAIALIIHEECGGTVLIAGWANRAAKRIAALRRAQPPQPTGYPFNKLDFPRNDGECAELEKSQQTGSTLSRGQEIEEEFYRLKAQEWAVEPSEAKRLIGLALCKYSGGGAWKNKPEFAPIGAENVDGEAQKLADKAWEQLEKRQPPQPQPSCRLGLECSTPVGEYCDQCDPPQPTGSATPSPRDGSHQGETLPNGDTASRGGVTQSVVQPPGDAEGLIEHLKQIADEYQAMADASGMKDGVASKRAEKYRGFLATIISLNSRIAVLAEELDLRRQDEASATEWLPDDLRSTSLGDAVRALRNRKNAAEARVAELEKALEPFAALTDGCDHFQKADDEYVCVFHIQGRRVAATAAQCRLARAALSTGAPG